MRLALVLLLMLNAPVARALDPTRVISQYGHTMWTLQNGGLPGTPTAMAQTTDGYLWVGTRNGLVRFDGVRFVPFTPPPGEELRSSRILSLRGSRDGSLWIGTRSGLHRWRRGRLTAYLDAPASIMTILEDDNGKVWFTRSSLPADNKHGVLCEVVGDRSQCHITPDDMAVRLAKDLKRDSQGNLWTVSDTALVRFRDGSTRVWLPAGLKEHNLIDVVQSVAPDRDGAVWVGAMQPSRGLGLLRLENDELRSFVAPGLDGRKLSVGSLWIDREQMLWIGTQNEGVYRWHAGKVSRFGRADGLSSDTVQNIFEDREGTMWILTTQGIDAFRDLRVASVSSREGLSADLANAVLAASDGAVWINAWHSLDAWRDGKMTSLKAGSGLPGEEVTAMLQERDGTLWIGIDRDLTVFESGKFKPIRTADGKPLGSMTSIAQDVAGDIWVVTHTPQMLRRIRDRKVVEQISRTDVPFIHGVMVADPIDGIWLPLTDGKLGRYRRGQLESFDIRSEPGFAVTALVAFADGTMMASSLRGLASLREGKVQLMTAENGLPCREIHTLLKDRDEGMWLYASCGVIFIAHDQMRAWWKNPHAELSFRVLDSLDGAQPARGNFFPKASVGPDGRLWFANAGVVQMVDPQRLGGNSLPPPVQIEQVVADRVSFAVGEQVQLPPNTRDLQIDYTGLSFVVPQKTRFRYRLVGYDSDWQDVGTRRQAFYMDLPPRDYVFQVTASNNDGVWNEAGAAVSIVIPPTFTQTRSFLVLCAVAAMALLWGAYAVRIRQVTARERSRLQERLSERERIARELHDTLLQGMQGLILEVQAAADAREPSRKALNEALDRADALLAEGRDRVKDLRSSTAALVSLRQRLLEALEHVSAQERAKLRVIEKGTPRDLYPSVREEVVSIASEAIMNALRHASATTIEIELSYERRGLRISVRDDGRGMEESTIRSGREGHFGLLGMQERTKRIRGELNIWSRPGAGTETSLTVPANIAYVRRRWLPLALRDREYRASAQS
ncbi:MAG TPA: two-component regulator propeller domain-containing protein [Steroidobacteraceae bacterium]|nr:two-component regulator propeller domain-containing protein [Steroidobacteraceae bacterium]